MDRLEENPDERRMFNDAVSVMAPGTPILAVADTLAIWHRMDDSGGSRSKLLAIMSNECRQAQAVIEGEREARQKCEAALRSKDAAMGVLFDRLTRAGVDCSDLIS